MEATFGEPLDLLTSAGDGVITIRCAGDIDLVSSADLEIELEAALSRRPSAILVVCDEVGFIDSSGIHTLIRASDASSAAGVDLRVVPSGAVMRVAHLLGVDVQLGMRTPRAS